MSGWATIGSDIVKDVRELGTSLGAMFEQGSGSKRARWQRESYVGAMVSGSSELSQFFRFFLGVSFLWVFNNYSVVSWKP